MVSSNPILFTIICVCSIQALILSGLIGFKKPRRASNIFLGLLIFFYAIMSINIVVVNVLKDYDLLYVFRYIQMEMLYGIGPCLYFYTLSISRPEFKFRKSDYWHFLPLILEFIFYRTSIYRSGSNGLYLEELPFNSYVYLSQQWLGILSIWIYSIGSLMVLARHQKEIKNYYSKIEGVSLKWMQAPILIFIAYHFIWRIITEVDRFGFRMELREYYFLPNFTLLSILTCWVGFKAYIQPQKELIRRDYSKQEDPIPAVKLDPDFAKKVHRIMQGKKLYLNPDLNLNMLANELKMKPKLLSAELNQNLNQNFYDFVNSYRVNAFKEKIKGPDHERLSILGLAFECGFSSKSTFNHVFKKFTKETPSQFLNSLKKKSE